MARDTILRIFNPICTSGTYGIKGAFRGECRISDRGCIVLVRVADTVLTDGDLRLDLQSAVDFAEKGLVWEKDFGTVRGGDFRVPLPVSKLEFGCSYVLAATFSSELCDVSDRVHFHYVGGIGQSRAPLSTEETGVFFRRRY